MDIRMPGRLDGISAARIILQEKDVPIVFVTGYDDTQYLLRVAEIGSAGFIYKPFFPKQIIATIKIALLRSNKLP
jgi:two-component system, sensor histidine kinase